MIDLKNLFNPTTLENLAKRGYQVPEQLGPLLETKKQLNAKVEHIHAKMNKNLHDEQDKAELKVLKNALQDINTKIEDITYLIPNVVHDTVPMGKGEEHNVVVKEFFNEKKFTRKEDHVTLGKKIGLDLETGADLAHARFNVMRGDVAKLHRKLLNTAVDFYNELGYELYYVPNLVNQDAMFGTGQYPKFKEELFITEGNNLNVQKEIENLYLIPTGEVPLTNTVRNQIFEEQHAEHKMLTHTPCFRREAGAYGKDTKGIIRQHQFEKIELVRTCLPENGLANLEQMVEDVTKFILKLKVPFRVIELCTGDLGFAGHKAYDFEIFFPAQNKYREIATITWCADFQARRMNTKVKRKDGKKEYLHTLNGTGLAVGRVLAALIENLTEEELKNFNLN